MQAIFSGSSGRSAQVPQRNRELAQSWAFNSNMKFVCKLFLDTNGDIKFRYSTDGVPPEVKPLYWEQDAEGQKATTLFSTSSSKVQPSITLNTSTNRSPSVSISTSLRNGFSIPVQSSEHGSCLLIAYLHIGGIVTHSLYFYIFSIA